MSIVRRLQLTDEDRYVPFVKRCYQEMNFDSLGYAFEDKHVRQSFSLIVQGEILRGYVYEDMEGVMLFSLPKITTMFRNGPKVAEEYAFHAEPDYNYVRKIKIMDKLLSFAKEDLKSIGVNSIYINSDIRFPAVSKLIQRHGGQPMSVAHYLGV